VLSLHQFVMAILQFAFMSWVRYYARNEWRLSQKRDDDSAWIQKITKSYLVVTMLHPSFPNENRTTVLSSVRFKTGVLTEQSW